MRLILFILTLSIFSTALTGDYLVFRSRYSNSHVFRAFMDSLVHATIGLLSSVLFFTHNLHLSYRVSILNVILCTLMSSFIDVDHAVLARSFHIKDMTNLKQRGFLHCTTLWLVITSLLFVYSYIYKNLNLYLFTYMIIIAYSSHHIRDANRRGIWFYPFGHTPPINKYVYVFLLGALPHLYAVSYGNYAYSFQKYSAFEYEKFLIV